MALVHCVECGRSISDQASICIGCGRPVTSPHQPILQGEVEIRRASAWTGKFAKFDIIIDGSEHAKVKDGESVRLPISAGKHHIQTKWGSLRSETIAIDLHPGQLITLETYGRIGDNLLAIELPRLCLQMLSERKMDPR